MRLVTRFGVESSGFADGLYDVAKFDGLTGLCLSLDGETLMCADQSNHRIRRIALSDGLVSTYVGSGQGALRNGQRLESSLHYPLSVCADPLKPNCYFIGDLSSIRYCDGETVSLIAGGKPGYKEGVGGDAMMYHVYSLLCTSDAQTLYFSDGSNYRLRCVDIKKQAVTTVCGDGTNGCRDGVGLNAPGGAVRHICFDRSPNTKPESAIFIASFHGVRRFDIATGSYVLPLVLMLVGG